MHNLKQQHSQVQRLWCVISILQSPFYFMFHNWIYTYTHTHIKTQLKAIIAKISVEWNGEKKTKKKKKKWVGANTLLRIWSIVSLSRSLRNIAMHSVTVRLWSPISEWHDLCLNWIVSVLMSRYTMTRYSNGLTCNGICENEKRKKNWEPIGWMVLKLFSTFKQLSTW